MPAGRVQSCKLSASERQRRCQLFKPGAARANAFVAANGGSLHAESRGPNLGATVSLRLPSAARDMAELAEAIDD